MLSPFSSFSYCETIYVTSPLKVFPWLSIALRIKFKLLNMTYQELTDLALPTSPASFLFTSQVYLYIPDLWYFLSMCNLCRHHFFCPRHLFFLLCWLTPILPSANIPRPTRLGVTPLIYTPLSACNSSTETFSLCITITCYCPVFLTIT